MSTVGNTYLNLADAAKAKDPNGNTAQVVEMLAKTNPMITDMPFVECNDGTRHQTTVRTGLPTTGYRQIYKGVPRSKSTRAQVTDTTGIMVAAQEVDELLLDLDSDPAGLMYTEAQAFIESLNQQFATDLLYADLAANPEKFHGLGPRFGTIASGQVISAGGSGADNTSIWLVTWGPNTVHGIFPKGTRAGIRQEDRGKQRVLDSNNDPYYAQCVDWFWHVGLCVRDPRSVVRVANIDVSDLKTAGQATGDVAPDLLRTLDIAYGQIESIANLGVSFMMYANATVRTYLRILAQKKASNMLTVDDVQGRRPEVRFNGVPIKQVDAIRLDEAVIP